MRKILTLIAIVLLAACSSGIVPMDKGSYMISEKAGGCGFATAGGQEADAYKKANEFCSAKSMHVETISIEPKSGIPFVRCASADLKFKCVP
jgi:hypothetical protein